MDPKVKHAQQQGYKMRIHEEADYFAGDGTREQRSPK
jgi:hypothetical protein